MCLQSFSLTLKRWAADGVSHIGMSWLIFVCACVVLFFVMAVLLCCFKCRPTRTKVTPKSYEVTKKETTDETKIDSSDEEAQDEATRWARCRANTSVTEYLTTSVTGNNPRIQLLSHFFYYVSCYDAQQALDEYREVLRRYQTSLSIHESLSQDESTVSIATASLSNLTEEYSHVASFYERAVRLWTGANGCGIGQLNQCHCSKMATLERPTKFPVVSYEDEATDRCDSPKLHLVWEDGQQKDLYEV